MRLLSLVATVVVGLILVNPAVAQPFFFSSGDPNGLMATSSRPASPGKVAITSADDFALGSRTLITQATFTGLVADLNSITGVRVGIYRVFPLDSDVSRTSGPPTFGTSKVPSRLNSPADIEFAGRSTADGNLSFNTTLLNPNFTAVNSVVSGINPIPNQTTGGDGSATGEEVEFTVTFSTPFDLPPDHYFFAPQVEINGAGNFLWLSSSRPIVPPGTPLSPDLESWIRNENLEPDWLRVGTDIVGGNPAPAFNAAFSLSGTTVSLPEPSTLALLGLVTLGLGGFRWRQRRRRLTAWRHGMLRPRR